MSKQQHYDTIIVGGGHNGLVCAWYLANAGMRVCVLERSHQVGGAAITEEFHPGFRNSVASYTVSLLQPKVIEDMDLYGHGLEVVLRKIDNYLPTENGYFLAGRNGLTEQEIARYSTADAEAYQRYQRELEREPVDFLQRTFPARMRAARERLADFLSGDADQLTFVRNATYGMNLVARSLPLGGRSSELPVGIVTALIGGPFFLALLVRGR